MVRKFIVILIFLLTIGVAGYFESHYIITSFDELESRLSDVRAELCLNKESIDSKENVQTLKNIHEDWQKHTQVLKFFVWHTGIKDVEVGLSRITSYTEENNFTEAYVELNNLIDYCTHYSQDYRFSIQNII